MNFCLYFLIITNLLANSADDKLIILVFLLFFPGYKIWHFMLIISIWDNMHEISKSFFWEKLDTILQYVV